ncbi:intraflagellar transport protein 56 isoform X2 [Macaca nemestrina]|uniref:intraflagellar transport protein 56 isoform X2 n=1 Tax=Macaca nemestrina TaxID=9545 RepID=UPI000D2F4FE5|nr:intraflagellar transport protein 56 isoform X2 [Macaca nemestrina]
MMLSRAKPAVGRGVQPTDKKKKKGRKIPKLEELLSKRDFTGAITLLEFKRHVGEEEEDTNLWLGYCAFHLGDYKRALEEYENATKEENCNSEVWVNLACTYFFLGMYKQAEAAGFKASKSRLQNRLLFHLAHKFNDEKKLMSFHQNLQDVTEDQLSLASIHYMRSHYQEAIDIYKRILLDNREYLALNVYVALCYYKLDYYDVSQEVLAVYLQQIPDSTIALNLKACNHFRLYNGRAAEAELKSLMDNASSSFEFAKELIRHNLVVFRGGEGALQVLPPLVDVIPEARLNLVIYYLRQDDVQEAYNLIKDLEPTTPQEYILKGVVNAALGQEMGSRDHMKIAQQFFQLVGGSASECGAETAWVCWRMCAAAGPWAEASYSFSCQFMLYSTIFIGIMKHMIFGRALIPASVPAIKIDQIFWDLSAFFVFPNNNNLVLTSGFPREPTWHWATLEERFNTKTETLVQRPPPLAAPSGGANSNDRAHMRFPTICE